MTDKRFYEKPVLEYRGVVSKRTLGNTSGSNPDGGQGSKIELTGYNCGQGGCQ